MEEQYSHQDYLLKAPRFEPEFLISLNESLAATEQRIFEQIKKNATLDIGNKYPMVTDVVAGVTIWTLVSIH